jgi:ribokinase
MPRVVVVGSCNMDLVTVAARLPRPGETVLGDEFFIAHGGKGANQAVAAARLGGDVTFVGRVGDDSFGQQLRQGLVAAGVDTTHMVTDPEAATGVAAIVVDHHGENCIVVASGANYRLTPDDVERAAPAIRAADVLLVQLESPLAAVQRAAELAWRAGVRLVLNPAPAQPLSGELLRLVSVLTPNRSEAALLAGFAGGTHQSLDEITARLRQRGVGAIVVTLGAEGAAALAPGAIALRHLPPFRVDAVDSTGAGDAFNGGLAVGLAEGRDLLDAVRLGMAAGALATTRRGAQPSLPDRDEAQRLLDAASATG